MRRPRLAFALPTAVLAWALVPCAAGAVDLVGTWHVLIHYKDGATNHPERERWEDRIWEISRKGDRLEWTEYPIVVFDDSSGRFERQGTNRASRVLHYWEPNEAQLAQIREGLEINPRGSRTKTLRGSPEKGWTSSTGRPGYQSARFITFTETWSIEGPPDAPVFTFDDVMGSASTESFEGRTRYAVESVESGGDVLRGRYERDEREGTFRMMRSGATSVVRGSGKTQGERVYEAFFGTLGSQLYRGELPAGGEEALRESIEAGTFTEADRKELRLFLEEQVTERWKEQGNDPRQFRREIQSLADRMTDLFVDEGRSFEEIQEMLGSGQLRP